MFVCFFIKKKNQRTNTFNLSKNHGNVVEDKFWKN